MSTLGHHRGKRKRSSRTPMKGRNGVFCGVLICPVTASRKSMLCKFAHQGASVKMPIDSESQNPRPSEAIVHRADEERPLS